MEFKTAWPTNHLTLGGEHITGSAATHPLCINNQMEVNIFPEDGPGIGLDTMYYLGVNVTNNATPGFESQFCDGFFTGTWSAAGLLNLTLQSTPRYKLKIRARRVNPSQFYGIFEASLTDTQTGTVLKTLNQIGFTVPGWFNVQGKRYGIGGVRDASRSKISYDDFVGTAVCNTGPC